jgi:hypothetical protein
VEIAESGYVVQYLVVNFQILNWDSQPLQPITLPPWSGAWTVFACSKTGIMSWNPTWGMEVCAVLCALHRADPPSKEFYRLCKRPRNWKSDKGTTKDYSAIGLLDSLSLPVSCLAYSSILFLLKRRTSSELRTWLYKQKGRTLHGQRHEDLNLSWTKRNWGRIFPSTSISPANSHPYSLTLPWTQYSLETDRVVKRHAYVKILSNIMRTSCTVQARTSWLWRWILITWGIRTGFS